MSNQELLEAIAPYLPHKVQLKCSAIFRPNSNEKALVPYSDATLTPDLLADMCSGIFNSIGTFKLILRPLSDLTKPCLEGGKVPIDEIRQYLIALDGDHGDFDYLGYEDYCHRFNYYGLNLAIKALPYHVVQWVHKHHFDIDGLIEKGYAIDINTLTTHK